MNLDSGREHDSFGSIKSLNCKLNSVGVYRKSIRRKEAVIRGVFLNEPSGLSSWARACGSLYRLFW